MNSLRFFQHILIEGSIIEEDSTFYIFKSHDEKDKSRYLITKNPQLSLPQTQKLKISAVPILSEKGIELFDVKFK